MDDLTFHRELHFDTPSRSGGVATLEIRVAKYRPDMFRAFYRVVTDEGDEIAPDRRLKTSERYSEEYLEEDASFSDVDVLGSLMSAGLSVATDLDVWLLRNVDVWFLERGDCGGLRRLLKD